MADDPNRSPAEAGRMKAEDTADAAKARAGTLREEATDTAKSLAGKAKARASAEVEGRAEFARDKVAEAIDDTAETLRTAADRMSDGTPQSEAVQRAANTVHGVADQVRDTDMASLAEDLTGFARRYPVPFVAAAGVLGFAAGRFMRASARPKYDRHPLESPATSDYPVPAPAPNRGFEPSHAHKPRMHEAPAGTAGARPSNDTGLASSPSSSGTAPSSAAGSAPGTAGTSAPKPATPTPSPRPMPSTTSSANTPPKEV
jgi:uncharacterized protein YjbJ (UPF0337 family)